MPLATFNGYALSRATVLDVGGIRRLEKEIFHKDAYTRLELFLQMMIPYAHNYKFKTSDGIVAGFVGGLDAWLPNHPAWIVTLGVGIAYQRQGLGRYLLDWCEKKMRAERIRLTVRASNDSAIALYQSAGYIHMRRAYRYYSDGEDGFIMEKSLLAIQPTDL